MAQTEALVVSISEKGALVVQRNIAAIGTTAKTTDKSVNLMKRSLNTLAVLGIATGLDILIKQMAEFGQEMSTVGAITGALGDEFDALREKAKELGTNTRFSATQAAEGMTFLARAGFKTNEVMAAIGPTLQLAQAGALDLGTAADIASNVLTGFNIAATDAQRVIDVLALSANSANTNVQQLGEAMSYVAPISSSLGVSLEETAAAVEVLSNAGIQASRAGTNLTMVMRLMQSPTDKQRKVLEALNLTQKDVAVTEVGLTGALTNLKKAGISTTQMFAFFGRSAATASVLLRGAEGAIQEFTAANKDAEGTAKGVAEAMDKNLNGAILATKSAFEGLVLAFGDLGAESGLTKGFVGLAKALRLVAENLELTTNLMITFAVAFNAIKYAPFLQGLVATVTQFIALRQAVAGGTAVIIASAQADAMKAASALAVAKAEAKQTAVMLASVRAKQANLLATNALTVSSQFRINLMKQATVLEAQHAVQLKAVAAAQTASATATKAASVSMLSLGKALTAVKGGLAALALNPITIGLVALSAAVAGLLIAFDKMKKMQEEIEAVEERIYKFRLARLQAQVKDIQSKKDATKALEAYVEQLELENHMMGLSSKEKESAIVLTRALEIAKRDLADPEIETITNLLLERDAIRARNEVQKQEQALLAELKKPQEEFNARLALLTSLRDQDLISLQAYNAEKSKMEEDLNNGKPEDKSDENFEAFLQGKRDEIELLKQNSAEQEVSRALTAGRAAKTKDLLPGEREKVELLVAEEQALKAVNTEEEKKQQLLEEILGPQAAYNEQMRLLNEILKENPEHAAKITAKMAEMRTEMMGVEESAITVRDSLDTIWMHGANAIDDFVDGGIITFRGFATAVIADITKIIMKLLVLQAIQGASGGFGSAMINLFGAAKGASFEVGGSGGTDSQLVAFRATPGEQVDVSTPAQQAAQDQGQQQQAASVGVTIINLIDPAEVPAIMAGAAGEQVTLNHISLNGSTVRQAIS